MVKNMLHLIKKSMLIIIITIQLRNKTELLFKQFKLLIALMASCQQKYYNSGSPTLIHLRRIHHNQNQYSWNNIPDFMNEVSV
ncbi:unnamed protein product [Paramecium octaurelia]|uniref:Uncharacterized protein n=1 Tax=Paramecium octaurelia TaxID=43137 RepID=A0A8S1VHL6_PAROT|nr:unnamed protein product [Paramecium octaurelia]